MVGALPVFHSIPAQKKQGLKYPKDMRIEHSIRIKAPRPIVWEVTTDIERWPDWTPTVSRATMLDDKPFEIGSRVRLKQPGQPDATWTVTKFVPLETFTWESQRTGIRFKATHTLLSDTNSTESRLSVEATGFIAILLSPLLKIAIRRALRDENESLKARCEALAKPR